MLKYDDLVNDLQSGCKPRAGWLVGVEHERFLQNATHRTPLPYDGTPGILQLLQYFHANGFPEAVEEGGNLIGVKGPEGEISLEPAGQFEFSSRPCHTLAGLVDNMRFFYSKLAAAGEKLGFEPLDAAVPPRWRREDMPVMPKARYRIMLPYMDKIGGLGADMMLRTASIQVNLDFADEADMVRKYRAALMIQPAITALLANSRMMEGRDTGYASFREHIWTQFDKSRNGFPLFVFEDGMGFERYVDYALSIPMYVLYRDEAYIDMTGQSFADLMAGKLKGVEATLEDWHRHLSILYPPVRLKHYLECRAMDSQDAPYVEAAAAFWMGLLYDPDSLDAVFDYCRGWSAEDHAGVQQTVCRDGLETVLPNGKTLSDLAGLALGWAEDGLIRQGEEGGLPALSRLSTLRRPLPSRAAGMG